MVHVSRPWRTFPVGQTGKHTWKSLQTSTQQQQLQLTSQFIIPLTRQNLEWKLWTLLYSPVTEWVSLPCCWWPPPGQSLSFSSLWIAASASDSYTRRRERECPPAGRVRGQESACAVVFTLNSWQSVFTLNKWFQTMYLKMQTTLSKQPNEEVFLSKPQLKCLFINSNH